MKAEQRQLNVRMAAELIDRLDSLAEHNGRALVAELTHAIERHLAAPPTVQVLVSAPPLAAASIPPGAGKTKRGRPRKQAPPQ